MIEQEYQERLERIRAKLAKCKAMTDAAKAVLKGMKLPKGKAIK